MPSAQGPAPSTPVVVSPASRAFMAWQLATHWGNRSFARPAPRAEVVSAALLAGFPGVEGEVGPGGPPGSESPHPELARWRSAVGRALHLSRYAALLLAVRFADRAEALASQRLATGDIAGARAGQSFRAEMLRRAGAWREGLAADARYQAVLGDAGLAVNLALLAAWERLADGVCGPGSCPFAVSAPGRTGPEVEVALQPLGDRCWRARPWPLQGGRLQLHCEVRRSGGGEGAAGGPAERVTFTLLRPAARG